MKAAVITVSDGCSAGLREDLSGPALAQLLEKEGWSLLGPSVVPDERETIAREVQNRVRSSVELIVLTGGTGISARDVTPEAVRPLLDKEIPGLAELMRLKGLEKTEKAALSRSLAGSVGKTLILCLPGSVKGAVDSLIAVLTLLPHAIDLLHGKTGH